MLEGKRVIALIPARSGSKRLKNKNLLDLAGKPLIAWTIEAALNTIEVDDVIVSTDSHEIKNVALKFGAKVPFLRPDSLANDNASTDDVLMHAIAELQLSPSDILVLLQPTSPLRNSYDIKHALLELNDINCDGVVSLCECEHSPLWSNTLPKSKTMGAFIRAEIASKRSQDLPLYYRLNGAIYAYKVSFLNEHKSRFYSDKVKATVMPVNRSVDIDNLLDFKFAGFLFNSEEVS